MPALFAAAVLLLCAITLIGASYNRLRQTNAEVQRATSVLLQIAEVDAKLVGMEMTVRGYALTDDPAFLKRENYERIHLISAMQQLGGLIARESSQREGFAHLRVVVAKRIALYAYLSGPGIDRAREVARVITDTDKRREMLSGRLTLNALRDRELKLLQDRQAAQERDAWNAFLIAIGIIVTAFVLGGIGLLISQLHIQAKHSK
jgi:CHASE3 domain sensor protein